MFLHDTHLPQLLDSSDYWSEEQFQRELKGMFLPGWHCVGSLTDVPREGDYNTLELFGRPLLLWRQAGTVHAYLNVCTHRFCLLTDAPRGNSSKLKCQYHGWEYNVDGDTQRIPDAKSFRPLQKGELGLRKYRCELLGQLIFVTLDDEAPSLREYLGAAYGLGKTLYSPRARLVLAAIRPNRCNWKVAVENSLEGYHLAEVHAKTFRAIPPAENCHHELYDEASSLRDIDPNEKRTHLHRLGRLALGLSGIKADLDYHQYHRYPNLVMARFGIFSWLESTIPVSATDSYDIWRFFYIGGKEPSWREGPLAWGCRLWGRRFFSRVIGEDERVFPAIQRGLMAPRQPGSGLISVREERIVHFQQDVLRRSRGLETDSEDGASRKSRHEMSGIQQV
jgi:choline monooxygenase